MAKKGPVHSYRLKVHYPGGVLDINRSAPSYTEDGAQFLANLGRRCMQLQQALMDGEPTALPCLYDAAPALYKACDGLIAALVQIQEHDPRAAQDATIREQLAAAITAMDAARAERGYLRSRTFAEGHTLPAGIAPAPVAVQPDNRSFYTGWDGREYEDQR